MNELDWDPAVCTTLARLLKEIQGVLSREFVGLVVHGSLALGGFDPRRSDVDFLVVTRSELPEHLLPAIAAMHARQAAGGHPWAARLEGSYIPADDLRRYDPARTHHPALRVDGVFAVDGHGSDWIIQRHIIREYGVALAGPAPATLIDPVSSDALRTAALAILREWWAPQLQDHSRLQSSEYQAYAILTMCRSLHTLQTGGVCPKPVAAQWAQVTLGEPWADLIGRALEWGHGVELDELERVLGLIRLTLTHAPLGRRDVATERRW